MNPFNLILIGYTLCGVIWRVDEGRYHDIHFPAIGLALALIVAVVNYSAIKDVDKP